MEIVKIDPKEYGLEEKKAQEISKMFKPMLDQMVELEKEFNKIAKAKKIDPVLCAKARVLRMQYVKVRTGTEKIHKDLKAFYLQGGRFVDGWKNAQLMASQGNETKLLEIEKHFENLEIKRINDLQEERSGKLRKLGEEFIPNNLGTMDENVWQNYIVGIEENIKRRKEAEKKAEEERIEKERIQTLHEDRKNAIIDLWNYIPEEDKDENFGTWNEKNWIKLLNFCHKKKAEEEKEQKWIRKENERLKKQAEAKAKKEEEERKEREKNARILGEKLEADGYQFNEESSDYEKEGIFIPCEILENMSYQTLEATIIANNRALEDKRKLEKKIQEEEKARKEKEEAERIRKQKEEEDLNKNDQEKFKDLLHELDQVMSKFEFNTDFYKELYLTIVNHLSDVVKTKNDIEEN